MGMDFNSKDMYTQGTNLLEGGQYERAVESLTLSADAGNVDAQYTLGNLYAQGLSVAQNLPLAVKSWGCSILAWVYVSARIWHRQGFASGTRVVSSVGRQRK